MSQTNVELVLASIDAYNAGDIDACIDFFAPDIEVIQDASIAMYSPLHGRHEYRDFIETMNSAWIDTRWAAIETYAVGADHVLNRADWSGEGAASGIKTHMIITSLYTVRDGQIARLEYYFDHDKALKAVGLAE
jgi:ketosteroid isomerase-like protein